MKRTLILCGALVCGFLAGCGSDNKNSTPTTAGATKPTSSNPSRTEAAAPAAIADAARAAAPNAASAPEQPVTTASADQGAVPTPVAPPPAASAGGAAGVILPDPDEDAEHKVGPSLGNVPVSVRGKTYCAKEDLQLEDRCDLAVRTADNKVYVMDGAETKFPEYFAKRREKVEVLATGTPYMKDGVLHLAVQDIKPLR